MNWFKPATRGSPGIHALFKSLSIFERALIGAGIGGIAGAFTYVCLYPLLDTIKTKLQTKGASEMYNGTFDTIFKTFQRNGILGFYSGVSAVIVGSTASSVVYFVTCDFGKSTLSKLPQYPSVDPIRISYCSNKDRESSGRREEVADAFLPRKMRSSSPDLLFHSPKHDCSRMWP